MDANRFCTQCGNRITEQFRFCTNCGAPLEAAVPSVGNAPPGPPKPPPPAAPTAGTSHGQPGQYISPQPPIPGPPPAIPPIPPSPPPTYGQLYGSQGYQQPGPGTAPYGQQPPGIMQTQQFTGYAQQSNDPSAYSGRYQKSVGAGGLGVDPQAKRGGCLGKIFKTLLKLIVLVGILFASYSYLSSNSNIKLPSSLASISNIKLPSFLASVSNIRLPWSSSPDAKQFIGRWQVVSMAAKGKTIDMTKQSSQMILELVQANNNDLTGKLTYSSDTSTVVTFTLKPVDNTEKYEGTAVSSSAPKDVLKASVEYVAVNKELTLIVSSASEGTSTIKLKKI